MTGTREYSDIVRAVFDKLELMAWAIDTDGKILLSEGASLRAIGVEPGRTVGYNAFELYGNPESLAHMHRAIGGDGHVAVVEHAGRILETRYDPIVDAAGVVIGMTGITTDITERVPTQDAIDRQTLAMREQAELLDLAHDAIRVRRLDGTITYWNQGAERVFGFRRDDAIGQHGHRLLGTEVVGGDLVEAERQLLATGYWEGELNQWRQDGQAVMVSSRWVLKRGNHGHAGERDAVLEIDTDITARKQAEEAEARRKEEIIRAQALAIEELSTPLIPIVLRAAHAARLLGTEVILTGIRPEVAQTLVHIGADLGHITTRGTLQSGIAYALGRRGQRSL